PPCKGGLRVAFNHINSLFTNGQDPSVLQRILNGAKSAPRENRCYLPVQGSIIIPSIMNAFESEFQDILGSKTSVPEKVILPKISDYRERSAQFILKERISQDETDQSIWSDDDQVIDRQNYTR
ncbi:MAG: hypothetical protein WDA09_05245, partial [Bacteriovoracaceae bacterium]